MEPRFFPAGDQQFINRIEKWILFVCVSFFFFFFFFNLSAFSLFFIAVFVAIYYCAERKIIFVLLEM